MEKANTIVFQTLRSHIDEFEDFGKCNEGKDYQQFIETILSRYKNHIETRYIDEDDMNTDEPGHRKYMKEFNRINIGKKIREKKYLENEMQYEEPETGHLLFMPVY